MTTTTPAPMIDADGHTYDIGDLAVVDSGHWTPYGLNAGIVTGLDHGNALRPDGHIRIRFDAHEGYHGEFVYLPNITRKIRSELATNLPPAG